MLGRPDSMLDGSPLRASVDLTLSGGGNRRLGRDALRRHADRLPLAQGFEAAMIGIVDGYPVLCGFTSSTLVIAPTAEAKIELVILELGRVGGVLVDPARSTLWVAGEAGTHGVRSYRGLDLHPFAVTLARRLGQAADPAEVVLRRRDGGEVSIPGERVELDGDYVGGHPVVERPARGATLVFEDAGIHLLFRRWQYLFVSWGDVRELTIDGAEGVSRQVTAGRLLVLGELAVAFPQEQRTDYAYVAAETAGGDLIVRVPDSPHRVRALLGRYATRRPGGGAASAASPQEVAGALAQVAALHAAGSLTDAEFAAAKARIVGL